jgi:hypothetical protein
MPSTHPANVSKKRRNLNTLGKGARSGFPPQNATRFISPLLTLANRHTIRCSFKVLNGVACQKGERGRACTCNFSFMGLRLKFRHALKGIIPRYYRGSKSSCDHIGSPRSSRNGKCRSAEYARSRSSFTVLGRFCGSRQSRRRLRAFNSALRCSNRRDISLIGGQHFA